MVAGRPLALRTLENFIDPIWEQQIELGETDEFYTMYMFFANLRPSARTISNAWREWSKGSTREAKFVTQNYRDLAAAYHWMERASAHDVAELRERYNVWGQRDWDWREGDFRAGEQLRAKADKALIKFMEDDAQLAPETIISLYKISSELQKGAIPNIGNITANQLYDIMAALPEEKRQRVMNIVTSKWRDPKKPGGEIIEAEIKLLPPIEPKVKVKKEPIPLAPGEKRARGRPRVNPIKDPNAPKGKPGRPRIRPLKVIPENTINIQEINNEQAVLQ